MKSKYILIGACIALVLTLFPPKFPSFTFFEEKSVTEYNVDNLLKNGDFEQSLDSWDYDDGIFWSNDGGKESSGGLRLNTPEVTVKSKTVRVKSAKQCLSIDGGATYSIEASFRYADTLPQKSTSNRIHITWHDKDNCSGGGQYGGYIEPALKKRTWQQLSKGSLKPSLGARSAQIKVSQRQENNNHAEGFWDDIEFIETGYDALSDDASIGSSFYTKPISENYIENPAFESNLDSWLPRRSKRLTWRGIDDAKHGGVMAATLPNSRDNSIGTGSFNQCVNLGEYTRYELGAQVKVDANSSQRGGGRLRATWYEGNNCKGRYRSARGDADVDRDAVGWQELHVGELKPREGSKSVSIGIVHSIDGKGEHTLLWDNFYFRAY